MARRPWKVHWWSPVHNEYRSKSYGSQEKAYEVAQQLADAGNEDVHFWEQSEQRDVAFLESYRQVNPNVG